MDFEEFEKLTKMMKAQGLTDEDLLKTILKLYTDGKVDIEDMKKMAGALGYKLSEKFLAEQEAHADANAEGEKSPEDLTPEEVEDAQETDSNSEEDEEDEDSEEDEEDEKKQARKLFF